MLLNLCFHIAMTAAVFAGGITLTGYLIVCQAVGTGAEGWSPRAAAARGCSATRRAQHGEVSPRRDPRTVTGGDAAMAAAPPYPPIASLPQVGIILHYSSLSTLLWMAVKARVLYKEVTWKAPRQPDGDASQPAPRPMLRYEHPFPSPRPHRSQGGFPCPTARGWGRTCSAV